MIERRWRGEIDVPLTAAGLDAARKLGARLEAAGGITLCYHDWLRRCRDTARSISSATGETRGPRPWRMGKAFEGHPITPPSLLWAQWYARHPEICPDHGGEPFGYWYSEWMRFLNTLPKTAKTGVVTHNRNIQAAYATVDGKLDHRLYNCEGPDFCTVHFYHGGKLIPWDGHQLQNGVYLIRHGETAWGT